MGIFLILLSITLVIFLVFKGVPVFYSAVFASMFCLLTAALFTGAGADTGMVNYLINGMTGAEGSYVSGLGGYFTKNFCIFVLGAIFGKLFDNSGAADAIAEAIVGKLGAKAVIPAILLVGWVLTYGGVSVFVAFFAMYPLMLSLFKEADIPRRLLPLYYFAGAGTSSGWFPGSPQAHNLLPATALGVSPSSWLVPGILFAVFEMVLVVGFVFYYTKRCRKNGEHYELTEADRKIMAEKEAKDASRRPSWMVAALPMVVLIVVLNVVKLAVPVSLLVGILVAVICFFQVCHHNRQRVDDGISIDFCHFLIFRQNPLGRDSVCGFNGFNAIYLTGRIGRFQRQIVIHKDFTARNLFIFNLDDILVCSKACRVAQTHRRNDKAHILCILPSENDDTANQLAAACLVHHWNQTISEIHLDWLNREQ